MKKFIVIILSIPILIYSIFFIILNKKIFKNKYIFVSYVPSFGHQCIGFYSMNYLRKSREKVTILQIIYNRNNNQLINFFKKAPQTIIEDAYTILKTYGYKKTEIAIAQKKLLAKSSKQLVKQFLASKA